MSRVAFTKSGISIDGQPVQLVSGAIHYFRVPAERWRDRLEKAARCGLNAVETYLCWNLHEPRPGDFDFSGDLDFVRFIRLAGELGLRVIVRPGPYICAEWENGGLPAWLTARPEVELRRMNAPYLEAVGNYLAQILPRLAPLQLDQGGPLIALQIENEYGSYGTDKRYLQTLHGLFRRHGITLPLFTADGAGDFFLNGGTLEGIPAALTFGSHAREALAIGRRHRPDDPSLCMEFWDGWFDAWGVPHRTRGAAEVADEVEAMLEAGASVNLYMFHGGTNFGFCNGANASTGERDYAPQTTSYDYDAPLSECGDPTEKYFRLQALIRRRPGAAIGECRPAPKADYGEVPFDGTAPLLPNLDTLAWRRAASTTPLTMERLGQAFGFIHYRTRLAGPVHDARLALRQVHDRAIVLLDGQYRGTFYRNDPVQELPAFEIPPEGAVLDLLVENMGRINYGPLLGRDAKGIVGSVTLAMQQQFDWEHWCLPLEPEQLSRLSFGPFEWNRDRLPAFHHATLEIDDAPQDTFLVFPGVKGVAWVNGRNLGRYWNIGPASTLYLPGCWLKSGRNDLLVLELEQLDRPFLRLIDHPELG